MNHHYTTGLDLRQLDILYRRLVRTMATYGVTLAPRKTSRPKKLTGFMQMVLTITLLRTNVTQQTAAEIFKMSQSRISQIKTFIEPFLNEALEGIGVTLEEVTRTGETILVDGTYVPIGNRRQCQNANYSGKRRTHCVNIQVASTLDGQLIAVSPTVAGARHDKAALDLVGWTEILKDANWMADLGYVGTNAKLPKKTPKGTTLNEHDKEFNRRFSSIRIAIEHCNAHLKNWKILSTGYRRQFKKLSSVIELVAKLELFRIGWEN